MLNELLKIIDNYTLSDKEEYFGRLFGLLIFRFEDFKVEILDEFKECLDDSLQKKIIDIYKVQKKAELDRVIEEVEPVYGINTERINNLEADTEISSFENMIERLVSDLKRNPFIFEQFVENNPERKSIFIKNYLIFRMLEVVYNDYRKKLERERMLKNYTNNFLKKLYADIGVDLMGKNSSGESVDGNFNSYGLITIKSGSIDIFCDKDNQVLIDSVTEKNYSVLFGKRLLLECLKYLYDEGLIKDLSFRVDGISSSSLWLFEDRDFGASLSNDIGKLPKISKFYNLDNPEDGLWIFHDLDRLEISFEELYSDFELLEDNVVTQLVHLEYYIEANNYS
ncbi:hypothetical protein [uncultured Psychrobacter sp.]|uniref:hypothetical protein n=1 Tax=uncultured Psychrobacter sp. TaxID=259303 RepID=UPI0026109498|nr:hypothetical protein [uncultured Psychrobacter sp.]